MAKKDGVAKGGTIDLLADARKTDAPGPVTMASDPALKQVATLSERAVTIAAEIEDLEAQAAVKQADLRAVLEEQLPEAMDAVGLEKFKTTGGKTIEIKRIVAGSIPVANRVPAFAWLRKNKHDHLIKRELSLSFGRGEDAKAQAVVDFLKKKGLDVEVKDSVHAGTLGKWARELLDEGKNIPTELLGIFVGRRATIK